jgi:hypothetical protein
MFTGQGIEHPTLYVVIALLAACRGLLFMLTHSIQQLAKVCNLQANEPQGAQRIDKISSSITS